MRVTRRTIRLKPLRAALRRARPSLTFGLTGLMLVGGSALAGGGWDCRTAPDGRGWQCYQDGEPVEEAADGTAAPPAVPDTPVPDTPVPDTPVPDTPVPDASVPDAPPPAAPVPAPAAARPPAADGPPAEVRAPDREPPPAPPRPVTEAKTAAPPPVATRPAAPTAPAVIPEAGVVDAAPQTTAPVAGGLPTHEAFRDSTMPDLLQPTPEVGTQGAAPTDTAASGPGPLAEPTHTPAQPAVPVGDATTGAAPRPLAGGIDAGIDWTGCGALPAVATPGAAAHDPRARIDVSADGAVAELDRELAVFSGDVQLVQGSLQLRADALTLNRLSGEVTAQGGLQVHRPDIRVAGSAASYQLATGQGRVEQASYRIPAMRARGDAERAELLGDGKSRYAGISYTTCAPGDTDWLLSADALELDHDEGLGRARHASLRFLGVPVLYAPVFTFPIDDRRRSGLLVPSIGQSENTGFDLSLPYYLNLAPNYDLTLVPRLMSKRGLMLGGEFRFLTPSSSGTLVAEYLPNDREAEDDSDDRGSASLRAYKTLGPQAAANLRLNYASDNDYLRDFGTSLAVTSATHLERAGEVVYNAKTWDALARVQYYQTIDDAIRPADRPYSRLPQLALRLYEPDGAAGLSYHLDAEYVNFHRNDSVHGHRINLSPALSLPLRETWGFVEPKIGARYTAYDLTDQTAGLDDTPSTLSGMFSLDSGLHFDRATRYFASAATQTLEPRLYYLYVPDEDQDDQPVFDTGAFDFNFDNLFRESRFNGPDRFADANQVTLALTSRLISDEGGTELLRASLGQILYFADRTVTLPGETRRDDSSSTLVGEFAARLGRGWNTRLGLQWDPHDGDNGTIDQALAQLNYQDRSGRVFNAAYRLRDQVTEQTDLAVFWPVNEQFSLVGRHNYSLQDDRLLEALAGIEYGRCCWRFRFLVRQYADDNGDDQNLGFLLQLELNGLGRFGDDIQSTLARSIYGYGTNDYD